MKLIQDYVIQVSKANLTIVLSEVGRLKCSICVKSSHTTTKVGKKML